MADSGDYWKVTFLKHLEEDFSMQTSMCDVSIFFKMLHYALQELIYILINGPLSAGKEMFETEIRVIAKLFDAKPREHSNLTFSGLKMQTQEDRWKLENQSPYQEKRLKLLSKDYKFKQLWYSNR